MKPELVATIFGVALAVFAGAMKLSRNISTKKREKLSVQPSLLIDREMELGKPIKICLRNNGAGPAYIDSFEVFANSIKHEEKVPVNLTTAIAKLGLNSADIICYSPSTEEEIPGNSTKVLVEANPINVQEHELICSTLPGLTFKIKYSSIYGDKFYFCG